MIAIMNMILHGIEAPNVIHTNSLTENLADIQERDRYEVILANPPFGGKERKEIQQNFPVKSAETAYLFLQHFIKYLRAGGRAAIVIKNTFLSNTDNASVSLRKLLLESCNLHTVLAYDTEYAMVDRDDDLRIGMKTSAITLGRHDVAAVMAFYLIYLSIWAYPSAKWSSDAIYLIANGVALAQVAWHYTLIRARAREGCFKAFRLNHWLGFTVFAGVALSYLLR